MKSDAQIIEVHKRTIEAYTKKECTIVLTDAFEKAIKRLSLYEIFMAVEKHNATSHSIVSKSRKGDVVTLKKIFCLLAKQAGYSAKKTGVFLQNCNHVNVRHHIRSVENSTDEEFNKQYQIIQTDILKQHNSKGSY